MSARKNPPSFVLVEKATGLVVYTKRATGVGTEAINKCVWAGRAKAQKTGKTYFVFLDIGGLKIGQFINVAAAYAMGITEEIRPNVQRNPRERVRRNVFLFNNPPSGPADEHAARELELYIDNDSQLYHSQFIPIVKNLMLKRRKGVYDREKAVKLFMYLMDSGAKKYVAEFGTRGQKIDTMFNRNTRLQAARVFRDSFETEAELGNYDRLIGPVSNPLNRKEVANIIMHSKDVARSAIRAKRLGDDVRSKRNLSYGRGMLDIATSFSEPGARSGVRTMLDRYDKIERRESSRSNPGVRKNVYLFNNPIAVYEVFVGNIGRVYFGDSKSRADRTFDQYVRYSKEGIGSAAGEDVSLICEGELSREYTAPKNRRGGGWRSSDIRNNPRQDNQVEAAAREAGLLVATWAPGDGSTRYRFFVGKVGKGRGPWADYHQGNALYTAMGRKDALSFIVAYKMGRHTRRNPLTVAESREISQEAFASAMTAKRVKGAGAKGFHAGRADGMGEVVRKYGPEFVRQNPSGRRADVAQVEVESTCSYKYKGESLVDVVPLGQANQISVYVRGKDGLASWVKDFRGASGASIARATAFATKLARQYRVKVVSKIVLKNPLLQTVFSANPPISAQWDSMSRRQKAELIGFVGYPHEVASVMATASWKNLSTNAKRALERQWLDSTSSRGTTRRRMAMATNPLTRQESGKLLREANSEVKIASVFRGGHTRSQYTGSAIAKTGVVQRFGPRVAARTAHRIQMRAAHVGSTVSSALPNPGVKLPKPGTKLTVAQALDLAQRLGNKELVKQCHAAMKLQKAANKGAKCVIWKVFPMGSSNKIDSVVALTHYGDSPETMYRPPKGSKKGNHMYRHKWGEKGGKPSVPLLASPDGKMLMMPLEGKKVASDWLRH